MERPGCVTIYAILLGISAALAGLAGLGFGFMAMADSRVNLAVGIFIGIIFLGGAGFQFLLAKGLWDLKNWARIVMIVLNSLAIISPILTLFFVLITPNAFNRPEAMPILCGGLVQLAISGYFIYWFADNGQYFR